MQDKLKVLKIITVSVLIFIVLLSFALITNLVKLTKASAREKRLQADLSRLEQSYKDNEDEITTKQDKEYIIRYARQYLGMKFRDESVYTRKIKG